jgi:hypothetical protein
LVAAEIGKDSRDRKADAASIPEFSLESILDFTKKARGIL